MRGPLPFLLYLPLVFYEPTEISILEQSDWFGYEIQFLWTPPD